jgi:ABC-type nitrate/sulfonate/bicarbonate transport system permease component
LKDEELLQDALGQIGDDLILEGNETPKRKTNRLPKVVAAAACFALLLGLWQLMPRAEQPGVPTWPPDQTATQPTTVAQTPEPEIVNLWEREGFQA